MIQDLSVWWHRSVLVHEVTTRRVTVALFDSGARGLLVWCGCGKVWAL